MCSYNQGCTCSGQLLFQKIWMIRSNMPHSSAFWISLRYLPLHICQLILHLLFSFYKHTMEAHYQFLFLYLSHLMTKPTKWQVHQAKTQISLGIRPVWSESLLSTWRKLGSLTTHWAHSKDSDQTGRMPRLIWVFAGRTCHFVGFVMRRLIFFSLFV